MDLEVREIPIQSRAMYNSRLKSYKQEVEKLEKDFVSIQIPSYLWSPSDRLLNSLLQNLFCKNLLLHIALHLQAVTFPETLCFIRTFAPQPNSPFSTNSAALKLSVASTEVNSEFIFERVKWCLLRVCCVCLCCCCRSWPCLVIHKSLYVLTWSLASIKA